jgi:hypothetical protein
MTDVSTEKGKKSPRRTWLTLGASGVTLVVLVAFVVIMAGGWVWHKKPSFCAVCHTPMKSYVDGYKGGDDTLMITPHATGETILHRGDKTLTTTTPPATGKTVVSCLDCHEPKIKQETTEAFHWMTGNYVFPLKQRKLGTSGFCLASGCHDEAKIIKATKDYGGVAPYNVHDPRHGKQECYRCHLTHRKSVLMCNQCHKLKLPKGWVAPAVNGVVPAR